MKAKNAFLTIAIPCVLVGSLVGVGLKVKKDREQKEATQARYQMFITLMYPRLEEMNTVVNQTTEGMLEADRQRYLSRDPQFVNSSLSNSELVIQKALPFANKKFELTESERQGCVAVGMIESDSIETATIQRYEKAESEFSLWLEANLAELNALKTASFYEGTLQSSVPPQILDDITRYREAMTTHSDQYQANLKAALDDCQWIRAKYHLSYVTKDPNRNPLSPSVLYGN